jgi:type VI secretion system protein ImpF
MAELTAQERLQPALLDRLTDDDVTNTQPEPRESRVISKARLRQAVLRDLAWLFNATRYSGDDSLLGLPHVQSSVINFGLPALSGETASSLDITRLEDGIREAILSYEPRILPSTLDVQAVIAENQMDQHNVVSIEIRGNLWAHPVPIEFLLRTDVDLETGEVHIRDMDASGFR